MIDRTILLIGAGTFVAALIIPNLASGIGADGAAPAAVVADASSDATPPPPPTSPSRLGSVQPDGTLVLAQQSDGHFHADPQINGIATPMMVDTGATVLVLTEADAQRAGVRPSYGEFNQSMATAGGRIVVAPVVIDRVRLGRTELRSVEAAVVRGNALPVSLMGQSVLNRMDSITISAGEMRLR